MPEREIYCSGCQEYLGTIFKARLKKEIAYLCKNCEQNRYLNSGANSKKTDSFSTTENLFGGIFSDILSGKGFKKG